VISQMEELHSFRHECVTINILVSFMSGCKALDGCQRLDTTSM
jgi:hypothetical protein